MDRRQRTLRHALRAKKTYLERRRYEMSSQLRAETYARACELGRFRKASGGGCGCIRKKRGNPKIARGMCHGLSYHPSVLERVYGKRLCKAWSVAADVENFDGDCRVRERDS